MTAYSAMIGSSVFAAFVDSMLSSHTVTCHLARARCTVECGRPPTGGPVRSDSGKNARSRPPMQCLIFFYNVGLFSPLTSPDAIDVHHHDS